MTGPVRHTRLEATILARLTLPAKSRSLTETPFHIRGRDWLRLTSREQGAVLATAFRYWRAHGFPYYRMTPVDVERDFRQVVRFDWRRVFSNGALRGPNLGLRLANAFHPSMWRAGVSRYRTPMDVFQDDRLLRAALERALMLWPDRFALNASCLRRMLKTFPGTASVSNFKPTIAKAVIARYSNAGDLVVDFSAGYGGRLVGCLTLPRRYLGIEPSASQVRGLVRTIRALAGLRITASPATICRGCAEEALKRIASASTRLVFSSPPYFDWERYARDRTQSFLRYRTYQAWRDGFLVPVLRESYRILGGGGHLAMNISNGRRQPSPKDVTSLARRIGFRLSKQYRIAVPKTPYLHPRDGSPEKCELVLVFKKPGDASRLHR